MISVRSLKYIVPIVGFFVAAAAIGAFMYREPSSQDKIFISASQLSPYSSHEQTRTLICAQATGAFFKKVCQEEFDKVSRNDSEHIDELFAILVQAKNDATLSDYDKILLSQLIFATLPTGESPLVFQDQTYSFDVDFFTIFGEPAYAEGERISRAQYEKHLIDSLTAIKENCPAEGDDAWILTVMCSEHTWINGVHQPIYSREYGEAGGACVFTPVGEAEAARLAHSRSDIEIKMRNENTFSDASRGVSNQIACAFSCISHKCPEPDKERKKPTNVKSKDYTERGYKGPDLLQKLLNATYKPTKPTKKVIDTQAPPPIAPVPPPPQPKQPEVKVPSGPICCYDARARNGIRYYLPFSGGCEAGDVQVPFDSKCANPLTE